MIFLSFRFYVKLILEDFRSATSAILAHFEALNFDIDAFLAFLQVEIDQNPKFRAQKMAN